MNLWDATAAGIESVEKKLGVSLKFGGPAVCGGPANNQYLIRVLDHYITGKNVYNGNPARLDYISAHVKGQNSSYHVTAGELAIADYVKSHYPSIAAKRMELRNDESDPLVGWATLQVRDYTHSVMYCDPLVGRCRCVYTKTLMYYDRRVEPTGKQCSIIRVSV